MTSCSVPPALLGLARSRGRGQPHFSSCFPPSSLRVLLSCGATCRQDTALANRSPYEAATDACNMVATRTRVRLQLPCTDTPERNHIAVPTFPDPRARRLSNGLPTTCIGQCSQSPIPASYCIFLSVLFRWADTWPCRAIAILKLCTLHPASHRAALPRISSWVGVGLSGKR